MALPTGTSVQDPNYLTKVGNINAQFVDLYDLNLEPQVFQQIFSQSGRGFGMLQFLGLAGRTINVPRQELKVFEYGREKEPITLGSAIATTTIVASASPETGTFTLDSDNYNTNGNGPIREGDSVYVPAAYTNKTIATEWRVTSKSGTTSSATYKIKPYDNTAYISTEVPIGTELMVGAYKAAPGTGQPTGKTRGLLSRSYYPTLLKESLGIEGGTGALARYTDELVEVGFSAGNWSGNRKTGTSYISTEMAVAQWRLMDQFNTAFLVGDYNSNSVQETSHWGGDNDVLSGKGYWNLLTDLGMSRTYNTTWEMWDFDVADALFTSQQVIADKVYFGMSRDLMRKVENSGLDFISDFSETDMFAQGMNKLGINIKAFNKSNRTYYCFVIDSFNNPDTFGIEGMGFEGAGFMIPDEMTTFTQNMMSKEKVTIPNLTMANIARNGENRGMMMGIVSGVNGYGRNFSHEYDGEDLYMAAERMLIAGTLNHQIKINKV